MVLKFIKKLLTVFFVILGVVFFIVILTGVYLYVADPFELKPLLSGLKSEPLESGDAPAFLSEKQKKTLELIGLDPSVIPSGFTSEQIACFVRVLGQERVDQIVAGDAPTPAEYFKAKECL